MDFVERALDLSKTVLRRRKRKASPVGGSGIELRVAGRRELRKTWGRAFQAEGTAVAKALRLENGRCVCLKNMEEALQGSRREGMGSPQSLAVPDPCEDLRVYWGGGETGQGLKQYNDMMCFLF